VIHWVASTVERSGERRIEGVAPEEVAARLDVTPAQVRDVLAALERAGLVSLREGAVEVPHPGRLGQFLEFLQTEGRPGGTR
jgi:Mn-dependent DtxR family transcriptional regulator